MIMVDARGLGCPKPVMMAEEELNRIDEGNVDLLVDNEAAAENLRTFARKNGFYSETLIENNYWRVKIVKGPVPDGTGRGEGRRAKGGGQSAESIGHSAPSKQPAGKQSTLQTTGGQAEHPEMLRNGAGKTQTTEERAEVEGKAKKEILLIIGTDTLGREEELGKILIKGFFETMKVTKEIPDMIFFLNTGVKLTTTNKEIIPVLKGLEAMGVEIFSCGTCLKYFALESELKVGYRGTTNHIVEGMIDYRKVVWI